MAATPATTFLKARGVAFELLEYVHDPRAAAYGMEACEKLGLDPASVFKTLVIHDEAKAHAVALVPAAARLSLAEAARALGWKRAVMADPGVAQRLTGYVLGGISPFGLKRPLPVLADTSILDLDRVHVSGGKRGLEIRIEPSKLANALNAKITILCSVKI